MGNRYKTASAVGINSLQAIINSLPAEERIVKIVKEEGALIAATQYTSSYKNADQYLVITEIEDVDGSF